MRTVEFTCYADEQNQWRPVTPTRGEFHRWGTFSESSDGGVARWTVAIVEDEDGKIYRVPPECLRFTDKGGIEE